MRRRQPAVVPLEWRLNSESAAQRNVLLADARMADHLPILRNHRSELHVVFVKKPVDVYVVLANLGKFLGSPPS